MPVFSKASREALAQCHPLLQKLADEAIQRFDFKVIEGHRGKEAQDRAFAAGRSRTPWPKSKHNAEPSLAFDAVPYPLDWNDLASFQAMAEAIKAAARDLGIPIVWGGDWKRLKDMPHFELSQLPD